MSRHALLVAAAGALLWAAAPVRADFYSFVPATSGDLGSSHTYNGPSGHSITAYSSPGNTLYGKGTDHYSVGEQGLGQNISPDFEIQSNTWVNLDFKNSGIIGKAVTLTIESLQKGETVQFAGATSDTTKGSANVNPTLVSTNGEIQTWTVDLTSSEILSVWAGGGDLTIGSADFPAASPVVPEPSSLLLCGIGALGMGFAAWRRKRKANLALDPQMA